MKNSIFYMALILYALLVSCTKLKADASPFIGKWNCLGMEYKNSVTSCSSPPCLTFVPYQDCFMQITERNVIYSNHSEVLKLRIKNYTITNSGKTLKLNGVNKNGEKLLIEMSLDEDTIRGPFYSKFGFIDEQEYTVLGIDSFGMNTDYNAYYLHHIFVKE